MTKIIMYGCSGHMGREISKIVSEMEEVEIVAGVSKSGNAVGKYNVYKDINEVVEKADVIIDFSSVEAIDLLLDYCEKTKMPLVLCTTGLSEKQIERANAISKESPLLRSANMSLGINTMFKLIKEATLILAKAGFDMEIVEKHHNQKKDAPSGTALALADVLKENLDGSYFYRYDRSNLHEKRDKKEIGISAVRGGNIVGEHDVIFAGLDEVITLQHTAYSKAVFAKGAIEAAIYLKDKKPGLYTMADVIG